ncbi:MAG: hypothetical protein K2L99_03130 [Muribaculaceae bacterium]|nr:hypothetical protein [Muribaculaceae bacterium]
MKYTFLLNFTLFAVIVLIFSGCASMRPPVVNTFNDDSVFNYRYFYLSPTGDYSSSTGVYANQYGIYGGTTKSTNPSSIISGILFKNGYIQVNEVNPTNANETMIVNFGETGRRNVNLGYSIEVTIQFISAANQLPICSCTAEGQGETEADDFRKAIQSALDSLFKSNQK